MEFTKEEKELFMLELLDTPKEDLSEQEKGLVEAYWMGYDAGSEMTTNVAIDIFKH